MILVGRSVITMSNDQPAEVGAIRARHEAINARGVQHFHHWNGDGKQAHFDRATLLQALDAQGRELENLGLAVGRLSAQADAALRERDESRDDLHTAHQMVGEMVQALQRVGITELNVQNPGAHIDEMAARLREAEERAAKEWTRVNNLSANHGALLRKLGAAEATVARLRGALGEIAKGEGRFSRDPLTHAGNTIEDMIALAKAALAAAGPQGDAGVPDADGVSTHCACGAFADVPKYGGAWDERTSIRHERMICTLVRHGSLADAGEGVGAQG